MPLQLPPSYTVQTKNLCISALLEALNGEREQRKTAIALGDFKSFVASIEVSFFYVGFGCALSVVSTTHLNEDLIANLNSEAKAIIDMASYLRSKALRIKQWKDSRTGEIVDEVKIPLLGVSVNSASLAGWENKDAKENLVGTIIKQLQSNIGTQRQAKEQVNTGKMPAKDQAEYLQTVLNSSFLFGFLAGIRFAKGDEELYGMESKVKLADGNEYEIGRVIPVAEREFKNLDNASVIAKMIGVVSKEQKPIPKPQEIKIIPPIAEDFSIARYLAGSIGR